MADDVLDRFAHHPPKDQTIKAAHEQVRANFSVLAGWVDDLLPDSPDKDRAVDSLHLASMYTNAAIARGQTVNVPLVEGYSG